MPDITKAKLTMAASPTTANTITFDYNPENLSYSVTMQTSSRQNQSIRARTSNQGNQQTAQTGSDHAQESDTQVTTPPAGSGMQISFDTVLVAWDHRPGSTDPGSVKTRVDKMLNWTKPLQPAQNRDLRGRKDARPPLLSFSWGTSFNGIKCHLTKLTVKYIRFTAEGVPTAATLSLQLTEVAQPSSGTNPTSGGVAPIRGHVVKDGDSLPSLAFQTYGEARYWRALARANDIDDPLRLRPGTSLRLPTLAELDPGT